MCITEVAEYSQRNSLFALYPKVPVVLATGYAELPPDAPRELPRVFLEGQLFSAIDQPMAAA